MNTATHMPVSHQNHPDHRDDEVFNRLQASEIFRDYQQAFQTATGLPLVLRSVGSFRTPLQGSKQLNPFCALVAGSSQACAACLQVQQRVESEALTGSRTLSCFAGLSESVVPVLLGEKVIAYLQTGQVFLHAPTAASFRLAVRRIKERNATIDVAELETAYFHTRVLPKARYDAVLRLLGSFAQHLSLVSNELMIKQAAVEPPAVSKARAFIAEHLGEMLSLRLVAKAANMSPFYFCKIFKSALGVTFTDYIARARVEKTKQLLLNPHVRVSEAAYEAGFQSLSQFNRVFRRVTGESPSTYRDHLHGAAVPPPARRPLAFAA